MQINKIYGTQTFGKTPVLTCRIKDWETKQPHNATLYKMDPNNFQDLNEILYSKNTNSIKRNFMKAHAKNINYKDFYVMQNDRTMEVISCAQTEHRYGNFNKKNSGLYTLIEEMEENPNYINGMEPLTAGIIKNASARFDESIYTSFRAEEAPYLKRAKFSKTKEGAYYVPQKRFNAILMQAENRSQIDYYQ